MTHPAFAAADAAVTRWTLEQTDEAEQQMIAATEAAQAAAAALAATARHPAARAAWLRAADADTHRGRREAVAEALRY